MKSSRVLQVTWLYFRIGSGTYLNFPLSFLSNMAVLYELVLKHFPFFDTLHFSGFILTFGTAYILGSALVGVLHMNTQQRTEAEVSAEKNPYAFKIQPFGISKRLSTPSSLTGLEVQDLFLRLIEEKWPEFDPSKLSELRRRLAEHWQDTNTLLEGGELR